MFNYEVNYTNLIHISKVTTNDYKKKITIYLDGGKLVTQTFADDSEYQAKVAEYAELLVLIGTTYYNEDRISIVVPNGKKITFHIIGNITLVHEYEDASDVEALIARIEPNFIEINGKWYQGKQIHVAKTNDITLTIDYDYLGMDWFTVTYEDQDAYDAAVAKLAALGNGGTPQPVTPKTAKPTFSPSAGSVEVGTSVTISCADDATIYYTTDGSTPDTSSSVYSSPIAIPNEGLTIKAVAKAADKDLSAVASARYTVSMQTVATPTFSPMGGSVPAGSTIIISCDTAGATIHYTTDGSEPDETSPVYTDGVTVGTTAFTLKAYAVKENMHDSATVSENYTVAMDMVATPVISPNAGAVNKGTEVSITCETAGAEIHYTTDGTNPNASSPVYSAAFVINAATTVKAIGIKSGMTTSNIASAVYTIAKVATPTFTPAAGQINYGSTVAIACDTVGATIYYTTDGSTPSASSTEYTAPIELTVATTIKAIAVKSDMDDSSVASAAYTIHMETVATPTFSPSAGAVNIGTEVSISCATGGAEIHYTTDSSTPNASSPVYSSAITIDAAKTIKAIAIKTGMTNSSVASASYTIAKVATPSFSVPAGEVESGTTVTITCSTGGATIHYTTDGTDPTSSSPTYSTPIAITSAMTLKAIAVKANMTDSEIKSANYTVAVVLTRYAGWVINNRPIGGITFNKALLEGMEDLQTDTVASKETPANFKFTGTAGSTSNARPTWAYPAQYGNCTEYFNGIGWTSLASADSDFSSLTADIDGVTYNIYIMTTRMAPNVGEEYPWPFR